MNTSGNIPPSGALGIAANLIQSPPLIWRIKNILRLSYWRGWYAAKIQHPISSFFGLLSGFGKLEAVLYRFTDETDRRLYLRLKEQYERNQTPELKAQIEELEAKRQRVNYGVLGYRVVTTAFVNFVVDQLQTETSELGDFKYHDSGVGTTSEAVGDTDMETTDGESRATGTQVESAANAYRSVGTIAYTTTKAITEHGLFSQSTGGTLMDRTVFSAINVVNGDSIQFTYTITFTAGS